MGRRFLLGAQCKVVTVEQPVAAEGAFIHLADPKRQLIAQPCRITQPFTPVNGPENSGNLFGALRAGLLNGIQERIDASVRQHLFPSNIATLEEMAATHVGKVVPVLGDQLERFFDE